MLSIQPRYVCELSLFGLYLIWYMYEYGNVDFFYYQKTNPYLFIKPFHMLIKLVQ